MAEKPQSPEEDQAAPTENGRKSPGDGGEIIGPPPAAFIQPPPSPPEDTYARRKQKKRLHDPPMFWVQLIGVIAVITYAGIAAWQACLSRDQLEEMRQDRRPWVLAPEIKPTVSDGAVSFEFTFRNVGRTPTTSLYVGAGHTLKESGVAALSSAICQKGKLRTDQPGSLNRTYSISPKGSYTMGERGGYIDAAFSLPDVAKDDHPFLAGCALYGSAFDKNTKFLHQTGFIAHLLVKNGRVTVDGVETINAD